MESADSKKTIGFDESMLSYVEETYKPQLYIALGTRLGRPDINNTIEMLNFMSCGYLEFSTDVEADNDSYEAINDVATLWLYAFRPVALSQVERDKGSQWTEDAVKKLRTAFHRMDFSEDGLADIRQEFCLNIHMDSLTDEVPAQDITA